MNKTILSAALVASFGIAALVPQTARATDGIITFTGKIVASTCAINAASGGATFTVTLPNVAASALTTSGSVAGTTPFALTLTGCTFAAATTASTYFEPSTTNIATDGNLKNTATATPASNVEVRLLNSSSATVNLNGANGAQNASTASIPAGASGGATLNYFAQYFTGPAAGGAVAGSVTSQVAYSITYQ